MRYSPGTVAVNKKFTFRFRFYDCRTMRCVVKNDCWTKRTWSRRSFRWQVRTYFASATDKTRAFRHWLPKLVRSLACSTRSVKLLPILVADSPFFTGAIASTVGDKRTLQALQHKELVFIRRLLLQLNGTMARCIVPRLAEAWKVASQHAASKTIAV